MDGTRKINHSERGNPDLDRQTWYVLTHKWVLDVKYRKTNLQFTALERLDNKEDPKRDAWVSLGRGNRDLLGNLCGVGGWRGKVR